MDMFSEPFNFRFGKKDDTKKTSIGVLTSLLVISASVLYLVYLILLYKNRLKKKNILFFISTKRKMDDLNRKIFQ
jgi:hypothetical protein